MRIVCVALGLAVAVSTLHAQVSGVAFDVASVKRNESVGGPSRMETLPNGVTAVNYPLRWLIARAYGIFIPDLPHQLIGGPDRLLEAKFDISAKAPDNTPRDRIQLMLQSLLADRFNFRVHREKRERPVYALTVARPGRLGDELRRSQHDCEVFGDARQRAIRAGGALPPAPRDTRNRPICTDEREPAPPGAGRIRSAGPLSELILSIQGGVDRPIIDATRLTGNFEWQLLFSRGLPDASAQFPSVAVALEEQLGLKLQPQTMPFEALVIDSLEFPTRD